VRRWSLFLIVIASTIVWLAPAAAQTPVRVAASIDDQWNSSFGRFVVPTGTVAVNFAAEMRSERPSTAFNDRPSLAITSLGGREVFFSREPISGGGTNDAPVALSALTLEAGTYELRPGGGRGTQVAIQYTLEASSSAAGPGEIMALRDADCQLQDATLVVPVGMKAINMSISTSTAGLPCTPGTLPPPPAASLDGPGFAYRWDRDERTGKSHEWPARIGTLELGPGEYSLRTGMGKLARTVLRYELVPLGAIGDVVSMNLPPGMWEAVTQGDGSAWIDGNELNVDSEGDSCGWFRAQRPYGFDNDYTVELEFRVNRSDGHWVWIWSDGFIALNTDWGLQFNHHQPGASYLTRVVATLDEGRWYQLRVEASPRQGQFRVYLDGGLVGTANGIEPGAYHVHGHPGGNEDLDAIYFGDDFAGAYNHGALTLRAIRVTGASPTSPAS
jgi:hypothetical protein